MEALERLKNIEREINNSAAAASRTRKLVELLQAKMNHHEPGVLLCFNPEHLNYCTTRDDLNKVFEEVFNQLGGPILRAVLLRLEAEAIEHETKARALEAQIEACISIPNPSAVFSGNKVN